MLTNPCAQATIVRASGSASPSPTSRAVAPTIGRPTFARATSSMDAPATGETTFQIGDTESMPADEQVSLEQSKHRANEAIEALPPRLQEVVTLYYREEWTLRDIGHRLGVTESRICQLQTEAIERMRAHCRSEPKRSASAARGRATRAPRRSRAPRAEQAPAVSETR